MEITVKYQPPINPELSERITTVLEAVGATWIMTSIPRGAGYVTMTFKYREEDDENLH